MSTVAAISTPLSEGGIAVIRISGDKAFSVAEKVFRPISSDKKISEMKGYTCAFGKIFMGEEEIDEGVLTVFRAPKSYTGEDVIEISCHGGVFVAKKVLSATIKAGCEIAAAGEFTKRAFLNGKLSLTEAESVIDIISAGGEQARKAAVSAKEGALYKRISAIRDKILKILGELSAWVDYPEEDIAELTPEELSSTLSAIHEELLSLSKTYDNGRVLRNGIDTAIVGRANVGKSTLMNRFLGFDRSIVTDIEGTTRDIVEETAMVGDILLKLSDTAGIRETGDVVESIGVERSIRKLFEADLVLAVFDASEKLSDEDEKIIEKVKEKKVIPIINKCEKGNEIDIEKIENLLGKSVSISAKTGEGIDNLEKKISEIFSFGTIDYSSGMIANERQKNCVDKALLSISEAVSLVDMGETFDALTVVLGEALSAVLDLSGERVTEAVVDEVFSHFCVGK